MTVTYMHDVADSDTKAFFRIAFRWRGSVWKTCFFELSIWTIAYAILSVIYRSVMSMEQKLLYEKICVYAYTYGDFIPISFMLGFFVNIVVSRWQKRFEAIGWVDNFALMTTAYLTGEDEQTRMQRRNIARYMCLLQVLVFRTISGSIKKRFPTLDTLMAAGYLEKGERPDFTDTKFYLPIKWAMTIVRQARREGKISSEQAVQDIMNHMSDVRGKLLSLWLNDWVPLPLVYAQVVFISVRLYFIVMIVARQYVDVERNPTRGPLDAYVPFLTMMQFMIYVGWMKVAEALLNPFGDDDDDFECNWILDRNLQVALSIMDAPTLTQPPLIIDKFWKDGETIPMYTESTVNQPQNPQIGSAASASRKTSCSSSIIMVPRRSSVMLPESNPTVIIDYNYRRPSLGERALSIVSSITNKPGRRCVSTADIPVYIESGGVLKKVESGSTKSVHSEPDEMKDSAHIHSPINGKLRRPRRLSEPLVLHRIRRTTLREQMHQTSNLGSLEETAFEDVSSPQESPKRKSTGNLNLNAFFNSSWDEQLHDSEEETTSSRKQSRAKRRSRHSLARALRLGIHKTNSFPSMHDPKGLRANRSLQYVRKHYRSSDTEE